MRAYLKNFRISPRKVRLVAGLVKGKKVDDALVLLSNMAKASALPLKKLLKSAVANAKSQGKEEKNLVIQSLQVDGGVVMKRMMPRARGSAYRIKKRTSHVALVLKERVKSEALNPKS